MRGLTVAVPLALLATVIGGQETELTPGRWKETPAKGSFRTLASQSPWVDSEPWRTSPTLIPWTGSRALLVAVEYEFGRGDRLVAREWNDGHLGDVEVIQPNAGEIVRPSGAVDAKGRPLVLWSQLHDGKPRLMGSRREAKGWTSPTTLPTTQSLDYNQELALHQGKLWVTWQSHVEPETGRGNSEIFAAVLGDDWHWSNLQNVTDNQTSDLDPCLASDRERLALGWVHFTGRDYEILTREWDPTTHQWSASLSLSRDPNADDIHPHLAYDHSGTLWCVYDSIDDPRRGGSRRRLGAGIGRGEETSLKVVCKKDGELVLPVGQESGKAADLAEPLLLSWSGGQPKIRFDSRGRAHVFYRYLDEEGGHGAQHSYPLMTQSWEADGWSEPCLFAGSEGAPQEVAIASLDHQFLVAWQQDSRHQQRSTRLQQEPTKELAQRMEPPGILLTGVVGASGIGLATKEYPNHDLLAVPFAEVDAPPTPRPHPLKNPLDPILCGASHFRVTGGDQEFSVYWGDLHRHSSVSRCLNGIEQNPWDRYLFGRDACLFDFMALTDHSGHIDPLQWWQLGKLVRWFDTPSFSTLVGYEWSTGRFGHQNVIFRDLSREIVSPKHAAGRTPKLLWETLEQGRALTIPHHSAHGRLAWEWRDYPSPFVRLAEVFQAARGSYEFSGCFRQAESATAFDHFIQDGLQQGGKFGLIAGTDHGNGASYAAVLAPELSREAIFDALHARRTYACTTKGMLIDFRINDHWMGEELVVNQAPSLDLRILGTEELLEVQVFRNGKRVYGDGYLRRRARPTEPNLELKWWSKTKAASWSFRLELDQGRFVIPEASDDSLETTGMELENPRVLRLEAATGETALAPTRHFSVEAPLDASVAVTLDGSTVSTTLRELRQQPLSVDLYGSRFHWALQWQGFGQERIATEGLGTNEYRATWVDEDCPSGESWYYARGIQRDEEMVWSSPIWVTHRKD